MTAFRQTGGGTGTFRGRRGFTLVELLVALALIIFLMAILSEAFVAAAKVFRDFKAIGDLAGRLRSASQLLRDDLHAYHFQGNKRLSDPNFWANGPPAQGFFRIWQQADANQDGGTGVADLEGMPSFTSTGTWLHFTVNKRGNNLADFFAADLTSASAGDSPTGKSPLSSTLKGSPLRDSQYLDDPTVYKGQWAEVAWFLKPNGATAGTTTLFSLHRRQLLAVPDNFYLNWTPNYIDQNTGNPVLPPPPFSGSLSGYDEISVKTGAKWYFNDPHDLTQPVRRFGMATQQTTAAGAGPPPTPPVYSGTLPSSLLATTDPTYAGLPICSGMNPPAPATDGAYPISPNGNVSSDVVLTDVISFDVRILAAGNTEFHDLKTLPGATFTNSSFTTGVYLNNSGTPTPVRVFDTWSNVKDATYDYSGWNNTGTPSATTIPLRTYNGADIQILAIQLSLRVWDFKTETTRQVTLVVDM